MSKEIETKEKQEIYPGSTLSQTSKEKTPFESNGTMNGMPYPNQVFKIIQYIHPTTLIPQDQLYPTWEKEMVARIMNILNEMSQLTPKKMDKLITMVKDSSITVSGTWEIKDFVKTALSLNIHQWEYILDKVKREDETLPEDTTTTEYKLAVIISTARDFKKENFEKFKALLMACPSFRVEADKLNLLESIKTVRSMPKKESDLLVGMVKDSSITLTAETPKEVEKTLKQLRQLTIEQVDEVFKMVKDSSIT